jgi:HAD superfamily hydrolase (TIGR01459 family)
MPERLSGLRDLRGRFDSLLVDLWGVIHDGERLYPSVTRALAELSAHRIDVVFLSNSSREGHHLTALLGELGVPRDLFTGVVSSGDVTRAALRARDPAVFSNLPRRPRCHHVGDAAFVPWVLELELDFVDAAADADLVIATGTVPDEAALPLALRPLAPLAARGVPLVCANPDRVVETSSGRLLPAGALAHAYAALGGPTFLYGKPHAPIFTAARRRLPSSERLAVVGDLLETDVRGARAAGLFGVLVTGTGVNAALLGDAPSEETLSSLTSAAGITPDATLPRFAW